MSEFRIVRFVQISSIGKIIEVFILDGDVASCIWEKQNGGEETVYANVYG